MKNSFRELNLEWLNKYFFVTEEDDQILLNPEKIIVDGGFIFFALLNRKVVGTCAMIKEQGDSFELAKMAVTTSAQGKGIGSLLLESAIAEARKRGALIVNLDTASPLESAIALYKKAGFVQTTPEHIHETFKRVTFSMEFKL